MKIRESRSCTHETGSWILFNFWEQCGYKADIYRRIFAGIIPFNRIDQFNRIHHSRRVVYLHGRRNRYIFNLDLRVVIWFALNRSQLDSFRIQFKESLDRTLSFVYFSSDFRGCYSASQYIFSIFVSFKQPVVIQRDIHRFVWHKFFHIVCAYSSIET